MRRGAGHADEGDAAQGHEEDAGEGEAKPFEEAGRLEGRGGRDEAEGSHAEEDEREDAVTPTADSFLHPVQALGSRALALRVSAEQPRREAPWLFGANPLVI